MTQPGIASAASARQQAAILAQALPYIRKYHGKTMVIKYGGTLMLDMLPLVPSPDPCVLPVR